MRKYGHPIDMSVYAIAIIPLMLMVMEITANSSNDVAKMVAYEVDFTAVGTLESLNTVLLRINSLPRENASLE